MLTQFIVFPHTRLSLPKSLKSNIRLITKMSNLHGVSKLDRLNTRVINWGRGELFNKLVKEDLMGLNTNGQKGYRYRLILCCQKIVLYYGGQLFHHSLSKIAKTSIGPCIKTSELKWKQKITIYTCIRSYIQNEQHFIDISNLKT